MYSHAQTLRIYQNLQNTLPLGIMWKQGKLSVYKKRNKQPAL